MGVPDGGGAVSVLEERELGTCAVSAGGHRKQTGTSQADHKTVV